METQTILRKRKMIRTAWLLFANCKYKHHINQKESNDKQKRYNRNTTEQTIRQKNKQQTTNIHIMCYSVHKKTRPSIQAIKNYRQVTVQNENSNNTTERSMIRTTWIIVRKMKIQR